MVGKHILALAVLVLALAVYPGAATVGTASIKAPAVILQNNTGSLTSINLTITNGTGTVNITGPKNVAQSTLQSAQTAASYAAQYTHHVFSHYDYMYTISDAGENVSGPSAGAAMTMLAISAFESKPLRTNFTMTGTINPNGSIGEIGGVYDKAAAAKNSGLNLILVPKVLPTDPEDELYLLVQTNFGIPLVQVANISQAAQFAFGSSNGKANETTFKFYTDYHTSRLPDATLNCSAQCNETIFDKLLNSTFSLTRREIDSLNANPKFSNVSAQLYKVLNQSIAVSRHGYIYTGADFSFLDYVNAFFFNGYPSNSTGALELLNGIQSSCSSLTPPALTESNYNYVLSAELRQYWGNYTVGQALSGYNTSNIESDQILDDLYLGAQSNGWCAAAKLVYNESSVPGNYVAPSASLKNTAIARLSRASQYGKSIYYITAQQAYGQGNYAVAILDSDYAYALGNNSGVSMPTATLNNMTESIAANATYGVWATEFAKESQFYVSESGMSGNATQAKSFAETGYAAALLAQQISNDTRIIHQNLLVSSSPYQPAPPGQPAITPTTIGELRSELAYTQGMVYALAALVAVLLALDIVLIIIVTSKIRNVSNRRRRK